MLTGTTIDQTKETLSTLTDESQCIDIKILDVTLRLEILKVLEVLKETTVQKYMPETGCGFVRYNGKSILAFNVRQGNTWDTTNKATVLVIEACRNNAILPVGFIINSFEDFYNLLK